MRLLCRLIRPRHPGPLPNAPPALAGLLQAVLEVLRASDCTSLRTVVIQLPPEAPLRSLHLNGCRQLQEVQLVAPRLLTLNLSHCGQLRSLSLRCKRLRELKAVNCTHLNLVAGELLCPALETLNLFGCRQLDAEGGEAPHRCLCCSCSTLLNGSCPACVHWRVAGLEAVAPSLTKLVSLDLTGCINLSRVLLPEAAALRTIRCGPQQSAAAGAGTLEVPARRRAQFQRVGA